MASAKEIKDRAMLRENLALYLRMEKRTYREVAKVMGISLERVRQLVLKCKRRCAQEAQKQIPYAQEVAALRPHIDSIKAIYEK
jgi:DNA-directed RNA polymerase sigma subunit (sigma70/sigma32)